MTLVDLALILALCGLALGVWVVISLYKNLPKKEVEDGSKTSRE